MVKKISSRGIERVPACISIGILAWNEAEAIGATLHSLFRQSLFAELNQRQLNCEILCVANGCTDQTAAIAEAVFGEQKRAHPFNQVIHCRALNLPARGKNNAWNQFVHTFSAHEAQILFLMDGDIVLQHPDTLWNMYTTLLESSKGSIATDQPIKNIALRPKKSLWERLSLATSRMTQRGGAQLTGQLYAIRAAVARNIYLPRDLVACEDGFIKAITCTCFLTRELDAERVVVAPNASHIFQAYTAFGDILRNQKRQMIGQTIVHLLVDDYLKNLPLEQRLNLAETIRAKEEREPDWLKRLIAAHLQRVRYFWRLFPDLLSFRFRRLAKVKGSKKLVHAPAAMGGFCVALIAGWLAHRFLKKGATQYWPDTKSPQLKDLGAPAIPCPEVTAQMRSAAVPSRSGPESLRGAPSDQDTRCGWGQLRSAPEQLHPESAAK